ncbi:MAG: menaquinone biosynthesis protein [Acidobacteriota bacterium]|nr:menaquinone biosynthesis protein [Acidobacteriota bacterium]
MSYLNTVPLVWGMLHGPQEAEVDLSFSIPSECARDIENGRAEVGLVPVAEIARQDLEIVPGVGICCLGVVRSILLFSRVPWKEVRTLSADSSSRTSAQLARVILRECYGVEPNITQEAPVLRAMLSHSDSALVIGDPALRLEPAKLPFDCLDLGAEWFRLTRLPFVFAAWAGKPGIAVTSLVGITVESHLYGQSHMDEIVESEFAKRGVSRETAHRYLTGHIQFTIGGDEQRGLDTFFEMANLGVPAFAGRGR